MEAESSVALSVCDNPMVERDVHDQQHEPNTEEVQGEEDANAQSQSAKKKRRRRRRKKGSTGESARDEELDKSLEEEKKEGETPAKERPTSAASSKKDNTAEPSDFAATPVKEEENNDEEDGKRTGSSKRKRKRNRKKKNTHEGDVEDGEKTPDSKPMESRPTNSTPKGTEQSPRKHESRSPMSHKKRGYETYWSLEEVSQGLKRGELLKGSVRINKRNFELAWVTVEGMKRDVLLEGMLLRNRALEGDIVALQLDPRNKWKVMKSELDDHQASLEATNLENEVKKDENVEVLAQKLDDTHLTPNRKTSSPSSKHGTPNKPRNADVPEEFLQRTASVVYIIEKMHSRAAGGHLKPFNKKNEDKPDALFSPTDTRLPRLRIPHDRCPPGFFDRPQDFAGTLFVARITDWPESSSFDNYFAIGTIDRSLGEAGEIMPETEAIFYEYEIDFEPFPDEVLACLPKNQPWVIPEDELAKRRDFRDECVFTIDPLTARDLDDALHCKRLPDGNIEVGVHIADVSYFVRQGTALDKAAQSRATSTYMVQMVVPMLPRRLCEELCSLNPDEDRLTVSVVWTMTEKGEILSDWKGRSIIKSRVKLAYEHAQEMIQNPKKKWEEGELPPISQGANVEDISSKVLLLHKIAGHLRRNRFENGALRLDQVMSSNCTHSIEYYC